MTLAIRAPNPDEAGAIARLWHAGWRDAHLGTVPAALADWRSLDRFEIRARAAMDRLSVAAEGATLLGLHLLHGDEIDQFYVAPEARGTGLARRLIAHAEASLAAGGYADAWLACAKGNTRARRFYEKAGWRIAREVPLTFPTDTDPITVDTWRMEKRLTPAAAPAFRSDPPV